MQKILCLFLACLLCLLLPVGYTNAFVKLSGGELCVKNTSDLGNDLRLALEEVERLDTTDNTWSEVRLIGLSSINTSYRIPDDTHFMVTTSHSLEISGGWDLDCTSQTKASPGLTILEGGRDESNPANTITQQEPGGVLSMTIKDNGTSTVSIENLTIRNGSSKESGGGLYFLHTATSGTASTVTLELSDLIVENNETDTFGGGIQILDNGTSGGVNVNITDCQILNNSADRPGGGIYINSGKAASILLNSVIAGNSVLDDNGGGIYIINSEGGDIILTNNTITKNETLGTTLALQDGGGLYVNLDNTISSLDIYNNIIFKNTAAGDGDDIYILRPNELNEVTINNCLLNDTPTEGLVVNGGTSHKKTLNNVTAENIDQVFVNADNIDPIDDDYRLADNSPAIDAGDNDAPGLEGVATDLDGHDRIQDNTVDMGAYEYGGASGGGDDGSGSDSVGGQGCFIASAYGGFHFDGHKAYRMLAGGFVALMLGIFLAGRASKKPEQF